MSGNVFVRLKDVFSVLLLILFCAPRLRAQTSTATSRISDNGTSSGRAGIDNALKAYVDAYRKRSLDDLVAIWPDLKNQRKEYKRIKDFFEDPEVSNGKVTLESCDAHTRGVDAVANCERNEAFTRTVTETQWLGDATMASPEQRPTPWHVPNKSQVKKKKTVWIALHKNGENWQIVSVSDKPL